MIRHVVIARSALAALALLATACGSRFPPPGSDALAIADFHVQQDGHHAAYLRRAEARVERGDLDGALADLRVVDEAKAPRRLQLDPGERGTIHRLRYRIHWRRGDAAAALDALDRWQTHDDGQPYPMAPAFFAEQRVPVLLKLGRLLDAEDAAAALLADGPAGASFGVGWTLMKQVYAAR